MGIQVSCLKSPSEMKWNEHPPCIEEVNMHIWRIIFYFAVVPYEYEFTRDEFDVSRWPTIQNQIVDLVEKYDQATHKVNMKSIYSTQDGHVTCLTKVSVYLNVKCYFVTWCNDTY